jgi:hypothetical protein
MLLQRRRRRRRPHPGRVKVVGEGGEVLTGMHLVRL